MSSLTVGWLIDLVRKKSIDENDVDFSDVDWISFYNLTLRLIVSLVPRAYALTSSHQMVSGVTQSIPTNGLRLVDVSRNTGNDGLTAGSGITEADYEAMKSMVPNWAEETASEEIEHFIRIPDMDASFHVYPPSDGVGYVEMVFSATPPTVTYDEAGAWETERIPVSDEFVNALPDGMLYHAYDEDSDTPGTIPRSQVYYGRLMQLLGLKARK